MYKTKHHASNQYITELYSETGIETLMKGTAILHKALSKLRILFYLSLSHLPPRARGVGTQNDKPIKEERKQVGGITRPPVSPFPCAALSS